MEIASINLSWAIFRVLVSMLSSAGWSDVSTLSSFATGAERLRLNRFEMCFVAAGAAGRNPFSSAPKRSSSTAERVG
jgi:hypothetical protein